MKAFAAPTPSVREYDSANTTNRERGPLLPDLYIRAGDTEPHRTESGDEEFQLAQFYWHREPAPSVADYKPATTWVEQAEVHRLAQKLFVTEELLGMEKHRRELAVGAALSDQLGAFVLAKITQLGTVDLDELDENLAAGGWLALARLLAADLIRENGRSVWASGAGTQVASALFEK